VKRFSLGLFLVLATLMISSTALAHEHGIEVRFNGRLVHFDVKPVIEEGRTLVPFRAIFEALGADVTFNNSTRVVAGTRGANSITMTLGQRAANVNGRATTLDVAPKIIDSRTMVPVRVIAETLGVVVGWDGDARRIDLNDATWPPRGGSITAGMISAPSGIFHPSIASGVYDAYVNAVIFEGLWAQDASLQPVANLATHWTISADSRTITFYVRNGARWHDGRPLTVDDAIFTFQGFMHRDYKGPRSTGWENLVGYEAYRAGTASTVSGLRKVGNNGIQFELKEVYAPFFLNNTGFAIIPKHLYENVPIANWGTAQDPNMKKPIGSGPFRFNQYVEGQFVVFDANNDYWQGRPYYDRLIWRVIAGPLAAGELEVGRIDYAEQLPAADIPTVRRNPRVTVHTYPGLLFQYMGMNTARAPFNDVKVRQAVAFAVDRQAIIEGIMLNQAGLMHSALHPLTWAYSQPAEIYNFNLAKANQLLTEAGWVMGSDGFRTKGGQRLRASLLYPTGNIQRENTAPVMQDMLKKIGMDVTLDRADFATLLTKADVPGGYDFDLIFLGFRLGTGDPDPEPIHGKSAIKAGGFNRQQWSTPKSEELLKAATQTLDIEKRRAIYAEWLTEFQANIPVVHLYANNVILAVHNRIGNFVIHPTNGAWNIDQWYVKF
jgi:peptide/nickel transport system substrate-binding protein